MIGSIVITGYVVLAVVLWPWGLLAAGLHLALLALFVRR